MIPVPGSMVLVPGSPLTEPPEAGDRAPGAPCAGDRAPEAGAIWRCRTALEGNDALDDCPGLANPRGTTDLASSATVMIFAFGPTEGVALLDTLRVTKEVCGESPWLAEGVSGPVISLRDGTKEVCVESP
mmetsp:Transcript_29376/g.87190  ORF Transcript_29376/g.87190 Transcript_29376/m.87190 type:complete len:130 (-) Transcript_29376:281-670(-)